MSELFNDINAYRGYAGDNPFVTKLRIGSNLYHVKDPAVDHLAYLVDALINTPGSMTIRGEAYDSGETAYNFLTRVVQNIDGQITAYKGRPTTSDILSTTAVGDAVANSNLAEILSKIIGSSEDTGSTNSIAGAKNYAYTLVQTLDPGHVSDAVQKIENVLEELNDNETGSYIQTIVDKLRDIPAYVGVGAYVTSKIDSLDNTIADGSDDTIAEYDFDTDSTSQVKVQIVQQDGILSGVTVMTNDIAKDSDLTQLKNSYIDSVEWTPSFENETITFTQSTKKVIPSASV